MTTYEDPAVAYMVSEVKAIEAILNEDGVDADTLLRLLTLPMSILDRVPRLKVVVTSIGVAKLRADGLGHNPQGWPMYENLDG